ncbi:MAG: acyl carrier protein [Dysgonamonadaceae bacterium]|jgi:acyl carrier protein|nr:acyl carrier protein [Dysgonamonadaceae bacterium]
MQHLENQIAEIFEVESLDTTRNFADFDEWDSLAALSILAILDSDYGLNLTQKELEEFPTVADFISYTESNAK